MFPPLPHSVIWHKLGSPAQDERSAYSAGPLHSSSLSCGQCWTVLNSEQWSSNDWAMVEQSIATMQAPYHFIWVSPAGAWWIAFDGNDEAPSTVTTRSRQFLPPSTEHLLPVLRPHVMSVVGSHIDGVSSWVAPYWIWYSASSWISKLHLIIRSLKCRSCEGLPSCAFLKKPLKL